MASWFLHGRLDLQFVELENFVLLHAQYFQTVLVMAILTSSRLLLLVFATMGLLAILGPDISVNAAPQPYRRNSDIEARDTSLDAMDDLSKRDPEPDAGGMPQNNIAREEKRDKKHEKKGGKGKKKSGHKKGGHKEGGHKKGGHKKGGHKKGGHKKDGHKKGGHKKESKKKAGKKGHKRDDEAPSSHMHRPREEYFLEDLD